MCVSYIYIYITYINYNIVYFIASCYSMLYYIILYYIILSCIVLYYIYNIYIYISYIYVYNIYHIYHIDIHHDWFTSWCSIWNSSSFGTAWCRIRFPPPPCLASTVRNCCCFSCPRFAQILVVTSWREASTIPMETSHDDFQKKTGVVWK